MSIIYRGLRDRSRASCSALSPYCKVFDSLDQLLAVSGGPNGAKSPFIVEDDRDNSLSVRMCGPTDYQVTYDDEVVRRPAFLDYGKGQKAHTSATSSSLSPFEGGAAQPNRRLKVGARFL